MASGSVGGEPVIAGSRRTDLVLGTLVLVVSSFALVTNALPTYDAVGYGVVTLLQLPSVLLRRYRPRAAMLAGAVPATLGFAVGVPSHTLVWAVLAFALFRAPGRALGLLTLVLAGALGAAAVGPPLLLGTPADVVRTTVLGLSVLLVLYAGIGAALGRVTRIARARERERHRAEERERMAAALDAERIRIVDEVGDGVLQGLRRLTARASVLAWSVPAASDPAAVSRLHEEARDVLAGMRRALSALREPVPVTGPDPGGAGRKPVVPAPTRSGLALAALLGLGASALALLGLEPVGDAVTDRFIALLDVPWTNPVSVALLLVQLLAVAWWRSAPISAFAVTTVVAIVNGSLGGTNQIVETGWMVLAYGVGVGSAVRISAAVVAGGTLAVLVAYLAVPALYEQAPFGPGQIALGQLVVVALWLVGVTRRGHRVQAETERRERRHRAEVRAREGERLRVARELHDVVAHHVSAISVQAGAATVTTDPAVRDEAFAHIGESGRRIAEALPQLESLTPNPGGVTLTADGLEDLVRLVRDAGVPVTCAVLGEPADPPGDPELFAQRILTEALTNVVRYAGPSATHVSLEHGPDAVSLRVTDTGPAIGHRPETGGSGLGLVGMRERAELLGGRVEAGHGDGGGWCVRARLPRQGGSPPSGGDRTSDLGRADDATPPSGALPSTITTTSPGGPQMSDSVREPTDTTVTAAPDHVPERVGSAGPDRPAVGWTEILVMTGAFLVLSFVGGIAAFIAGVPFDDPYSFPLLVGSAAVFVIAIGIALSIRVRRLSAIGIRSTTWRWIAAAVGIGLLLRVLAFGVILGYQALTGDYSNPQQSLADAAAGSAWQLTAVLIGGALLAPLTEELALRGVLYGGLRRYGVPIALIVSSVVFGLLHGWNVVLPVAILLGVVNALMYERSRSIWPPVVCHVVFNASAFTLVAIVM